MADLETSIAIKILDAFTAPLRRLTGEFENVEKRAEAVSAKFRLAADLNQAAEGAGRFADMMIGPLKAVTSEFAGFDHALSKLSAMTEEARGSAAFEAMKGQAVDLGAATQYSAQEVAELQTEFAQANFSAQQILGVTGQTLAAATAAGLGLGETAGIVAGALRGMGLDVSQTARVTDVLSMVSVKSDADLRGLSEALSYVAPVAKQAGMSVELTAAMIGKLSDAQIKGSSAGTGLRAVLTGLVDQNSKEKLNDIVKSTQKVAEIQKLVGEGRIDLALAKIGEATEKLPNEQKLKLLSALFGREASASAMVLIDASMKGGGLAELKEQADKAAHATQKMANIMQDDLMGAMERAGGAISGLKTQLGEAFAPTVKETAGLVEGMAGGLQRWTKENPKAAKATMDLALMLGGVALASKGVLLAASAHASLSGAIIAGGVAANGAKLSHLGLAGVAAAVGIAVGLWAREAWDLDNAIGSILGRGKPSETKDKENKDVETYAGGWEINKRTGEVVTMGKGAGPAVVQRARARGATTKAELSAVIGSEKNATVSQPMASRAEDAALLSSPLASVGTESSDLAAAAATKEQTAALLETLHKQEALQRKQLAEAEALRRRMTASQFGLGWMF